MTGEASCFQDAENNSDTVPPQKTSETSELSNELRSNYSKIMNKYPIISANETHRLFSLYAKTGNREARDILIFSNFRLVYNIAKKYTNNYSDTGIHEDIIQNGLLGLVKAVDTYDISKGFAFSTYATKVIEGYIHNEINSYSFDRLILMPRNIIKQAKTIRQFINDFSIKNEREPTIDEISLETGIPISKINIINNFQNGICSYDEIIEGQGIDKNLSIEQYSNESIEKRVEEKELYTTITHIIETLSQKEQTVIMMRYFNSSISTYKEISKVLGLTITGVRAVEKRAITKIKKELDKI